MNHDYWYNKWRISDVATACVLRVTNKCNQKCEHCAFRSGPKCVGQMSVKMCEKINAWLPRSILPNIMGGEFSILYDYPEMLVALARGRRGIRLVTNGFWAHSSQNTQKFFNAIKQVNRASCPKVDIAVSTDSWHQLPGHLAAQLLENIEIGAYIVSVAPLGINNIDPVGRAWDNKFVPKHDIRRSCERMSNMIITEDGMICRCPFGYFPWKYFGETMWYDAQEYVWGWRSERLAEGMNCHACMETEATQCRVAK